MTEEELLMEELESNKEEFQTTNETLQLINQALQEKLAAISRAYTELESLMAATEGGTLFLDRDLCITRFTAGVTILIDVTPDDIGRPLIALTHRLRYEQLNAAAHTVLAEDRALEDEIESLDGRWYLLRLRTYQTAGGGRDGVVITFIDITMRHQAEAEVVRAREYAETIVDTVRESLIVLTPDLRVKSANLSFYQRFQLTPAETEGHLIYELGVGQWNIPQLRRLLEEVLPENEFFNDYEVSLELDDGGPCFMILNARRLDHMQLILLAIEDLTPHTEAMAALRRTRDLFSLAVDASHLGWGTWDIQTGEAEWDERGRTILGFADAAEAHTAAGWLARIHPADRAAVETHIAKCLANGDTFRLEYRVIHTDGSVHTILGSGLFFQTDRHGNMRGTGLVQDITDQRQVETELRQLTETLEARVATQTEQVRALASTLTLVEHEERQRISQILHDDLQQLLYGIQMRMMMCIETIKAHEMATSLTTAEEIYRWLGDAIQTTRELTVDLSPPVLAGEGLAEALGWLTTQMAEVYRLHIDLQTTVGLPVTDKEMRVLLFQIVRELLFNVFKHAGTDRAVVTLQKGENETLIICVIDEGRGFDLAAAEARYDGGFGLFSVRERLGLFGGQIEINSAPGAGTHITINSPTINPSIDRENL